MSRRNSVQNFFEPKTIAVIGASSHEGKVGYAIMKNLSRFKGEVIPINPSRNYVSGKKAYGSVLEYKKKIDLAVIAIPADFVPKVMEECGRKGIKYIIIITAGFSEMGNAKLESRITKIADKHKITLLGPNCFGVCNPYKNLDTTFALHSPNKGNIAFISQSGALWSYISDLSFSNGFGISAFASLGNMAGAVFSDFIDYFSRDKKTKAIVIYVEKLKDGKRFIKAAKKCRKPIYAVKAGSSKSGAKAAISHTGSLATDFEIYRGAFKQAEIVLCETLEEAFEMASGKKLIEVDSQKKVAPLKKTLGKNIVILTNAGGAGALMADYCSQAGINIIELRDLLGTALAKEYEKAIMKTEYPAIVILTPQKMSEIEKTAKAVIDRKKKGKKLIAVFLGGRSIANATQMLKISGVPCFNTLAEAKINL